MSKFYDYDEASAVLGWTPATVRRYCELKMIRYVVRSVKIQWRHYRYRAIPEAEILRLQQKLADRARSSGERLRWPT